MTNKFNSLIYTIGHSNRLFEEFIKLLRKFQVNVLIDVRRYPKSKFEWFNKSYLESNLKKYGVRYLCMSELGALGIARKIKPLEDLTCTESPTYKAYITYLLTHEVAKKRIREIISLTSQNTCCIMCAERFPWRCHRNYLSDFLLLQGVKVIHIIDYDKTLIHKGTRCFNYIREKFSLFWK